METQENPRKRGPKPKEQHGKGNKIKLKGAFEFRHDLFKCLPAEMYKRKPHLITRAVPNFGNDLAKMEHCHFFHTFNSQGKPCKYTDPVGGHYHEITWEEQGGDLVARCGPPLHDYTKRSKSGKQIKKKAEPVIFVNQDDEVLTDDHTHDIEYIESEVLRPVKRQSVMGDAQQELLDQLRKEGITISGL